MKKMIKFSDKLNALDYLIILGIFIVLLLIGGAVIQYLWNDYICDMITVGNKISYWTAFMVQILCSFFKIIAFLMKYIGDMFDD